MVLTAAFIEKNKRQKPGNKDCLINNDICPSWNMIQPLERIRITIWFGFGNISMNYQMNKSEVLKSRKKM